MFTVEKGIKIPGSKNQYGRPTIYPLKDMEVGDSFFVPCDPNKRNITQIKLCIATRHMRAKGKKFTTRQTDEGIRVWRIE